MNCNTDLDGRVCVSKHWCIVFDSAMHMGDVAVVAEG